MAFHVDINTTCQSITQHFILYTIEIIYCQGDMFRPLLGHHQAVWGNRSKSYLYFNALWDPKSIETVYCEGDMFRPLLGRFQALWENRSKSYLYFNALWDPTVHRNIDRYIKLIQFYVSDWCKHNLQVTPWDKWFNFVCFHTCKHVGIPECA